MNIVVWIIFGALAGWLASLIVRTNDNQGALANIIVGILGAVIGGFISNLVGGPSITGFNILSIVVATFGAVVLLGIMKTLQRS